MNHETLQALYALDVAEVGEGEAAKRWEMYNTTFAVKGWMHPPKSVLYKMDDYPHLLYRRKPGIPWPKVMQPDTKPEWPADAPEWAKAGLITWYTTSKELVVGGGQSLIERPKPAVKKCQCCGQEIEA